MAGNGGGAGRLLAGMVGEGVQVVVGMLDNGGWWVMVQDGNGGSVWRGMAGWVRVGDSGNCAYWLVVNGYWVLV